MVRRYAGLGGEKVPYKTVRKHGRLPYLIITDHNYREYAGKAAGVVYHELAQVCRGSTGYLGWEQPGVPHAFRGSKPVGQPLPRSPSTAAIQAAHGKTLSCLLKAKGVKSKNRNRRSLCWCYGTTRAVETRRLVEGLEYLELAPESVAGPCTHWRDVGGFASEAFTQLQNGGVCKSLLGQAVVADPVEVEGGLAAKCPHPYPSSTAYFCM